jgi:putative solute:sodium symporter small subunit
MNQPRTTGQEYWRANLRLLGILLSIWFLCSFGLGILWVDWLDQFRLFGFKLGFWFAQQGSIYTFVVLIFVYVVAANRLDHRFGVDEDSDNYVEDEDYYGGDH